MKTCTCFHTPRRLRVSAAIFVAAIPAVVAAAQDNGNNVRPAPGIGVIHQHGMAGVVASISGSSIVIQIPENVTYTVQTSSVTRIGTPGTVVSGSELRPVELSDIHPGDPIFASGDIDEQARTIAAQQITLQPPFAARMFERQRANFGKTWTAGIVSAVHGNSITVARRDGRSQTFSTDDSTVWRLNDRDGAPAMLRIGERIQVRLRPAGPAAKVTIQGMTRQNQPGQQ